MSSSLTVHAPVGGTVRALEQVPDPVFAEAMVGPGLALDPDGTGVPSEACSPVAGVLVSLHPHAFVVEVPGGSRAVLVHLGIDTVQLRGEGFELLVTAGQAVDVGEPVVRWDPAGVAAGGRSALCPVVAVQADGATLHRHVADGAVVRAGDPLFDWA